MRLMSLAYEKAAAGKPAGEAPDAAGRAGEQ